MNNQLNCLPLFFQIVKNFTSVHLSYVELKQMGQQLHGAYSLHFHRCGNVDERGGYNYKTYVEGLSIHHCFSRCVTIHATNGLLVRAMNNAMTENGCLELGVGQIKDTLSF